MHNNVAWIDRSMKRREDQSTRCYSDSGCYSHRVCIDLWRVLSEAPVKSDVPAVQRLKAAH
jgi:hypothetical protein